MIATSPLTGRIYLGQVNKSMTAFVGAIKKDVTSEVLKAVIDKAEYHGGSFEIEGAGQKWTVTVVAHGIKENT
jgi:hypothetical protein